MSTTQDEQTLIDFPSHYQMQNILLVPSQKAEKSNNKQKTKTPTGHSRFPGGQLILESSKHLHNSSLTGLSAFFLPGGKINAVLRVYSNFYAKCIKRRGKKKIKGSTSIIINNINYF